MSLKSSKRWNTLYQGTSTAAGSSRLVSSTKQCPVCGELMVRGTGSLCVLGEARDFVLAHCLHCGNVAMEEHQHLPLQAFSQRRSPSYIRLAGVEVFEMSGNSRAVRVDFKYSDDEVEIYIDGEGVRREIVTPGTTNSTYLSDEELDAFLAMTTDAERKDFLLQLGQREWDALEDIRLMKEQCANLQANLDNAVAALIGEDLTAYAVN